MPGRRKSQLVSRSRTTRRRAAPFSQSLLAHNRQLLWISGFSPMDWLRKEERGADRYEQSKVTKWVKLNQRERALDLSTWFRQLDKSTVPNRVLLWNSIQLSFFMKAAFFIRPSSRLWIGSCSLLFKTFLQIQLDAFLPCWETEPKTDDKMDEY